MPQYESVFNEHTLFFKQYCRVNSIQPPALVELAYGANNALYTSTFDSRNAVVKIGCNRFFRRLKIEHSILTSLFPKSSPSDFYSDEATGDELLITPFIAGEHRNILSDDDSRALGRTIAHYHYPKRRISELPHTTAQNFLENHLLPVQPSPGTAQFFEQFTTLVSATDTLAASLTTPKQVLVHGDLIPSNIIFQPDDSIAIIDWEGARYDAPEADIATCIKAYNLNDENQSQLFEAYGHPIDKSALKIRLIQHYLQVISWRLAIELPMSDDDETIDTVEAATGSELNVIEQMITELQ